MGNWIRKRISLIATLCILAFFWIMTAVYGTVEVQQAYVKFNRAGIPAQTPIYTDHRPADPNTVWTLIAYPKAPLPFIVSLEVDMGVSCLWGGPMRQYFFLCPGYHTRFPIWGREVAGTYEDTESVAQ